MPQVYPPQKEVVAISETLANEALVAGAGNVLFVVPSALSGYQMTDVDYLFGALNDGATVGVSINGVTAAPLTMSAANGTVSLISPVTLNQGDVVRLTASGVGASAPTGYSATLTLAPPTTQSSLPGS